ncbi:hypothetical protein PAPYR_9663 [Paratrimastix pyriformis]|uniref:Uncharacterized protein n=1 Tax=Paratrimastix pyriformis TaxID=342808 RepID=A0ABQ8U7S3_9EUKA|nr:hypothetical protein PAPYR_9663 [Paratrimastix pyriformis]
MEITARFLATRQPRWQDKITCADLEAIKNLFDQRSLTQPQFVKALSRLLRQSDGSDLTMLFNKIDANALGRVTWEDFSGFILADRTARLGGASMECVYQTVTLPALLRAPAAPWALVEQVIAGAGTAELSGRIHFTRLRYFPFHDRLFTASPDGSFAIWDGGTLQLLRTVAENPSGRARTVAMVTDACDIEGFEIFCVATSDRCLSYYDLGSGRLSGSLRNFAYMPTALDSFTHPLTRTHHLLVGGDDGTVEVIRLDEDSMKLDRDRLLLREEQRYREHHGEPGAKSGETLLPLLEHASTSPSRQSFNSDSTSPPARMTRSPLGAISESVEGAAIHAPSDVQTTPYPKMPVQQHLD